MGRRRPACAVLATMGAAAVGSGLVVAAPAGAAVACGQTITTSTTLAQDLTCPATAILVGGSNVVLDLGGHTLTGPTPQPQSGRSGVLITPNRTGVTVRNGTIRGFDFGVDVHPGAINATVSNLTIDGSSLGIRVNTGANGSTLSGNTITNSGNNAIQLGGDNNRVLGNTLQHAGGAGLLSSGNGDVIAGNVISDSGASGIATSTFGGNNPGPFVGNQIIGNSVSESGRLFTSSGISVSNGAGMVVQGNTVTGRLATPGIFVESSADTVVRGNVVQSNSTGVLVRSSTRTVLEGNTAVGNRFDGISVESTSSASTIAGNSSVGNSFDGIGVANADATVTQNTANSNANWGINAVAGVRDGGGNRAAGNGQPAQCRNVVCS